jgi:hypothetical protein
VGDVIALAAEIEREREARENAATQERGASPLAANASSQDGTGSGRLSAGSQDAVMKLGSEAPAAKDTEGDVKMEA